MIQETRRRLGGEYLGEIAYRMNKLLKLFEKKIPRNFFLVKISPNSLFIKKKKMLQPDCDQR